jgi:hypothetical protein
MAAWNQFKENTYCNSESYNHIYDTSAIRMRLSPIVRWTNNTIIPPHISFLSQYLRINLPSSGIIPVYQYNLGKQQNRRNLEITAYSKTDASNTYVVFAVRYRYIFDVHSPRKQYSIGDQDTIEKCFCTCDKILTQKDWYTFRVSPRNLFHFTFHTPNNDPPEYKYRGAFHVRIDCLKHHGIEPYRTFAKHPVLKTHPYQYALWDDFDGSLNGFFTTDTTQVMDPSLDLVEIRPFLLNHPSVRVAFMSQQTGQRFHIIDDLVKPIYDRMVQDVMNPMSWSVAPRIRSPIAVEYRIHDPSYVPCAMMIRTKRNTKKIRELIRDLCGNGVEVLYGGGGRRTRSRRR